LLTKLSPLKQFLILIFLSVVPSTFYAQETIFEQKTTIYSKEISGGIGMHTNGFFGTYRYGKYLTGFTKRIYELEITNIRHPQEIKSINPFEDDVKGYIFGKMNNFYALRPSIGFHKVFVPKQSIKGVSITYVGHIGASLGLAKPIYLNVEAEDQDNNTIIVRRRYDPEEHDQDEIYGRASFFNGIDELKLYPGIFTKWGLHFDYANDRETLRAIEVGLMADVYLEKIPIMAFTENRQVFLNLYLTFLFGAREI